MSPRSSRTTTWMRRTGVLLVVAGRVTPRPRARLITLTTCSELFHTDDRLVASGHRDSRVPRTDG